MGLRGMQDLPSTSPSSSHFGKTHRDSSLCLNLRAAHCSPAKHHMHPSQLTHHKKTFRWYCPQVKEGQYGCMVCHRFRFRFHSHSRFTRDDRARGSASQLPSDEE